MRLGDLDRHEVRLRPPAPRRRQRSLRLYRAGQLKLEELVTRRYSLDKVNQGYQELDDGKLIRGVILHG
jgi:Zn-dependent alcohol dehydrogenase